MNSLIRLIYMSRVGDGFGPHALREILAASRRNNARVGITGMLGFTADHFIQVLEGGRAAVCERYHAIVTDKRHHDMVLLSFEEIDARRFDEWTMGYIALNNTTSHALLKYTAHGVLEPDGLSAAGALGLLTELACILRANLLAATPDQTEDLRLNGGLAAH